MKVSQLIALLQAEDPNAEVRIIDPADQGIAYDIDYNSQQCGVTQIPEKLVYLMAHVSTRCIS